MADRLVAKLKRACLRIGGKRFQIPGIIERDLADELGRDDWRWFGGGQARLMRSSKGLRMEQSQCHSNSAAVALQRGWECWTGLALSSDGVWRTHSWVRIHSTGTIRETTTRRTDYYGVKVDPRTCGGD